MATQVAGTTGAGELIALGRGRQALEQSVWYSGWLLTFLATGDDTGGRFALMEQVARQGNVPPRHIHHREDETFYCPFTTTGSRSRISLFVPAGVDSAVRSKVIS